MKHIWMKAAVAVVAVTATSAMGSACAHNDASIFIRQVFQPPIPSNGTCSYTADISGASISTGTLDVSYPGVTTYTPEVLVGNQIVAQANTNQLQAETSRVLITGAITRITDLAGNTSLAATFGTMGEAGDEAAKEMYFALAQDAGSSGGTTLLPRVNPFSTAEATAIEPGTGTTASYGALALTMVDEATVEAVRAYFTLALTKNILPSGRSAAYTTQIQLLTYTRVEGKTLGGDTVESNEFEFPVTLVFGGLVNNLEVLQAPYKGCGTGDLCLLLPATGSVCVLGQDQMAGASEMIGCSCTCPTSDAGTTDSGNAGDGG
jgi:hypothetical protein